MDIPVTIEVGKYGRRGILRSGWSADVGAYLASRGIEELELNQAKGWVGDDLSFLTAFPELKCFEILDLRIATISPIHHLKLLKRLGVTTYCSTMIDFSVFSEIESCSLEWRPKARSLFRSTTLKELFLNRYDGKDTHQFGNLSSLITLAILNAPVNDLHGLGVLRKLRCLRLANLKHLESLAGIESLGELEELDIHTCRRIRSIEPVGALTKLRKFYFNNGGDIDSLEPLQNLGELESVLFYESTNVKNGDLLPLLQLKNLAQVSFRNRRHYSHRREDFGAIYSE